MIRYLLPLCIVMAPGFCPAAFADPVQIRSEVLKETVVTTPEGRKTIQTPLDRATPGDTIVIRLTYLNEGQNPAADAVISNPLPDQLAFVESREGGSPQVSIDGGKTFDVLARLKVKIDDVERPAQASDVTHIRWRVAAPVRPGQSGAVAFAARLK